MGGTLFEEWLPELDRKFEMQGRKIVMIVNNCHAHPEVLRLKAIKLQFLPPNTTYCTQPMGQGIIRYILISFYCTRIGRAFCPLCIKGSKKPKSGKIILFLISLFESQSNVLILQQKVFISLFSTKVSLTQKPGSWFLLAKLLENTCGRVIF